VKKFLAGLGAAAILTSPLWLAAPASAAPLPDGDSLYAMSCYQPGVALFTVDALTADLTQVGALDEEECAGEAAYDPTTGKSYFLLWSSSELALVDVVTGVRTPVAGITGGSSGAPDSFAIGTDGKAYVVNSDELYSLDLTTAVLTPINLDMADDSFYAFSVDPTTGKFYAIQLNNATVYEVDVATGSLVALGVIDGLGGDTGEADVESLKIDTSGAWWFINEGEDSVARLYTVGLPSGATTAALVGPMISGETPIEAEALLLTYALEPALANTGIDQTLALTGAAGGALLATAGIVLVATRRMSRR
jgi:hypothetical protein